MRTLFICHGFGFNTNISDCLNVPMYVTICSIYLIENNRNHDYNYEFLSM